MGAVDATPAVSKEETHALVGRDRAVDRVVVAELVDGREREAARLRLRVAG